MEAAAAGPWPSGRVGAGSGATIGKWRGPAHRRPGGLGLATVRSQEIEVTAMIAGEIDRKDNLADVVVGIDTEHGPAVLVFEGPQGALDTIPEVIPLPASPTALALGRLDDDVFFDLAVAAGQELMVLRGRNSKVARRDSSRSGIGPAVLDGIVELDRSGFFSCSVLHLQRCHLTIPSLQI